MADYLANHLVKNVLVISPYLQYENSHLYQALDNVKCEVTIYHLSREESLLTLFRDIHDLAKFDLIITQSYETSLELQSLFSWFKIDGSSKFLIFSSCRLTHDDKFSFYEFDLKYSAKLATKLLQYEEKRHQIIKTQGFFQSRQLATQSRKKIRLLTIQSPTAQAMQTLNHRYSEMTGVEVDIVALSYSELLYELRDLKSIVESFDLIRIDVAQLQDLGHQMFRPLSGEMFKATNKTLSDEYSYVDNVKLTLPLDASAQMLFYRKDIFHDELVQRQYYELYRTHLQVPKTYEDFDCVSRFFTRDYHADSPTLYGHSQALGLPVSAACDILPRLRANLLKADEFLDENEVIKTTLKDYLISQESTDKQTDYWWSHVANHFATGQTAMAILFTNYGANLIKKGYVNHTQLGVAQVPDSQPLLGGGCIGISKKSSCVVEALDYLNWLYSDEISQMITFLGGTILNERVLKNQSLVELYPWLEKLEDTMAIASRYVWKNKTFDAKFETELGQRVIDTIKKGV